MAPGTAGQPPDSNDFARTTAQIVRSAVDAVGNGVRAAGKLWRRAVWRRRRPALRWFFGDEEVYPEWKGALLLAVAAIIGGTAKWLWDEAQGVQARQEFRIEQGLRQLQVKRDVLDRFAHEIPRNQYLLLEVNLRNLWRRAEGWQFETPSALGISTATHTFADGATPAQTYVTEMQLMEALYSGTHYRSACAQAEAEFPSAGEITSAISELFDLINDIYETSPEQLAAWSHVLERHCLKTTAEAAADLIVRIKTARDRVHESGQQLAGAEKEHADAVGAFETSLSPFTLEDLSTTILEQMLESEGWLRVNRESNELIRYQAAKNYIIYAQRAIDLLYAQAVEDMHRALGAEIEKLRRELK